MQLETVLTAGVLQEVVAAAAQLPQLEVAVVAAGVVKVFVIVEVTVMTPQYEVTAGVLVVQLEVTG